VMVRARARAAALPARGRGPGAAAGAEGPPLEPFQLHGILGGARAARMRSKKMAQRDTAQVGEDARGDVDMAALAAALAGAAGAPLVLGAFCAASNVTGVIANVDAVTEMLHRRGGSPVPFLSLAPRDGPPRCAKPRGAPAGTGRSRCGTTRRRARAACPPT